MALDIPLCRINKGQKSDDKKILKRLSKNHWKTPPIECFLFLLRGLCKTRP